MRCSSIKKKYDEILFLNVTFPYQKPLKYKKIIYFDSRHEIRSQH